MRETAGEISAELGTGPRADEDEQQAAREALEEICKQAWEGAEERAAPDRPRLSRRRQADPGPGSGAALAIRSARRCCQTEQHHPTTAREQHRREHVDLDGDPPLRGAEDVEREGDGRPGVEVGDDEVVDREGEGERAAATTPGASRGSVIVRKRVSGPAPRSAAASSSAGSKPISRERTTTTTKLIENITWAIRSVVKPRATSGVDEHREQRRADHHLRRRHRHEHQDIGGAAAEEAMPDQAERQQRCRSRSRSGSRRAASWRLVTSASASVLARRTGPPNGRG